MKIATATELPPRCATYERGDRKHGGDAREHDQLPDQQPERGIGPPFAGARKDVDAGRPISGCILRFCARTVGLRWCMAVGSTPVDDDLYREIILDHYRNPRHHQAVDPADRVIEANNPLCGDEIDLSYRLDNGTVAAIGFIGRGCSISQASASMLCEAVTGMSVEGAASLAERFRAMLTGDGAPPRRRHRRPRSAPRRARVPGAGQVRDAGVERAARGLPHPAATTETRTSNEHHEPIPPPAASPRRRRPTS